MNKGSKAYNEGYADGSLRVSKAKLDSLTVEERTKVVEKWFGPGQEEPAGQLIEDMGRGRDLAKVLGISMRAVKSQDATFDDACSEYNDGVRAGAREAAQDQLYEAEETEVTKR